MRLLIYTLIPALGLFLTGAIGSVVLAQAPTKTVLLARYKKILEQDADRQGPQLQQLIREWSQAPFAPDSNYINVCLESAKIIADDGNTAGAIAVLKLAEKAYPKNQSPAFRQEDLVKLYYRLGNYLNKLGDAPNAKNIVLKAINIGTKQFPASRWTSHALSKLAFLLNVEGDYEQAVQYAQQAVNVGERSLDDFAIANGLFEKSKALAATGQIRETRLDMERAVRILEKNGTKPFDLALYYVSLAYISADEGNATAGISYFQKAIALNQQTDNALGLAHNYTDFGYYLQKIGRATEAISYLQKAVDLYKDPYSRSLALDNLGSAYRYTRNFRRALTLYQQSIATLTNGFAPKLVSDLPQERLVQAVPYKVYLLSFIQDKADTWLEWAGETKAPTDLQNALKTYQLADQLIDYMRWEHTGQQSKLFWREKTHGMYERAIETCYRLGDAAQAFRFFEKSRAVLLADKLNELGARQQLSPQQMTEEKQLQAQVSQWQDKLSSLKPGTTDHGKATEELLTAQHKQSTFVKQLEKTNPAYYHYKYDNASTPLPMVQHWLKQRNSTLATYFVGDSTIYMLGVTPLGARLIRQPIRNYLPRAIAFSQLVANPQVTRQQFAQLVLTANQLYRYLLAPLKLPHGRIIVSSDGFFLPFEAFSRTSHRPDFLVNHQAFSYAYSISILVKNKEGQQPTQDFLGVAPVQFHGGLDLATLGGSDKSLKQIGNYFSAPVLLTKAAATRTAFLTKAPNCRVIQLFTHADADSLQKDTTEPILFFADSALKLSDLTNAEHFRSELLVLSACKTGIGANQKGEGVFSLARGFASVGIPSIVTTLWSVENQPTYRLTELFHQYLADGLPKDIALQRAKQVFIQEGTQADLVPSRWAGFILIGNAEPLNKTIDGRYWAIASGGLILLAVGGWRLRKRRIRLV